MDDVQLRQRKKSPPVMPIMSRNRRLNRRQPPIAESVWSFRGLVYATLGFMGIIMLVVGLTLMPSLSMTSTQSKKVLFTSPDEIPSSLVTSFDAILVLGGGVPSSLTEPPVYVRQRCDDAASIVKRRQAGAAIDRKISSTLPILCLSAGTAHMPQLLAVDGLPIWEATSSAAYLQQHYELDHLFVETTSYDTIGNAFFARTSHTDLAGWRRLLIVTNEFHMARSQAIFDWIFSIQASGYELTFLSSPNVGLDAEALEARRVKEVASLASVERLAQQYRTLPDVWLFLNTQHDLYAAAKLVERAKGTANGGASELVKKSYGGQ